MADPAPAPLATPRVAILLGLLALAVAVIGQGLLDQRAQIPAALGWGGLALGAVLFVLAERRWREPAPAEELAEAPPVPAEPPQSAIRSPPF
jgi:hypothetical protein